jgi:phosphohistidine phosphatase
MQNDFVKRNMDCKMDLILWRHAEAVPIEDGLTDADRPLTQRGERQAARMAQWLERQLPDGAKVMCSPTVRTQQTVLPLGRKFKLRDEISPQGTVQHALELAQWPAAKNPTVLVSHQPLIGDLVCHLLNIPLHDMVIKKGSVWWLRYKLKEGIAQVSLLTVQSPDML